ncbi:MAG: HAD family hydrolase [Saprospiraceae bacterium]|nr:HAD family hydrolase [Saprospiraceae bacterium]
MKNIKVIAFDADDTLWVNEVYYQETEKKFCDLLADFMPQHYISQELFRTEMKNLELYGYGVKSFVLSMIETLIAIAGSTASNSLVSKVIELGKEMLEKPIEMLEGVEEVLKNLNGKYLLVMATKGDLLDQERKLVKSGLEKYFHHIEIMSDKKTSDYTKMLKRVDCEPENFLMVGNSIKSDILPVLELGAYGIHIPFHTTWEFERVEIKIENPNFLEANNITDVLRFLEMD